MGVNLKSLIARLNATCRGALEGAAGLCLSRTNYDVEPEHFLLKLIESPDTDLAAIFRRYEINQSRVTKDLTAALDKLKTGNARTPGLSPRLPQLIQEAWLLASVDYGAAQVRSGHLLLALLASDDLRRLAREISREFAAVSVESLKKDFAEITSSSAEAREATSLPDPLKNVAVRTLDLGLLQAGAGIKGEFENRLKSVIDEVKGSSQPIILFIDEAHTMIGAGGQAGQNDAANLLKPALARGELRTIAATTWAEYKKYFEKDAALARRFQVVKVEEPDEAKAIGMMRGLAEALENHHRVRILAEAVEDAVRLSHRYISGRQLPDKSVSVLDTACARVAIGQGATPASVEDAQRRKGQLTPEMK